MVWKLTDVILTKKKKSNTAFLGVRAYFLFYFACLLICKTGVKVSIEGVLFKTDVLKDLHVFISKINYKLNQFLLDIEIKKYRKYNLGWSDRL